MIFAFAIPAHDADDIGGRNVFLIIVGIPALIALISLFVGADSGTNNAEIEKQRERQRHEAERRQREERQRQEAERRQREERQRQEAERRQREERTKPTQTQRPSETTSNAIVPIAFLLAIVLLLIVSRSDRKFE